MTNENSTDNVRDVDVRVAVENSESELHRKLQSMWRYYLAVEPVMFLFWLPNMFNAARFDTYSIRLACHNNLGYDEAICSAVAGKTVSCRRTLYVSASQVPSAEDLIMDANWSRFNLTVCKAAYQTTKLVDDAFFMAEKIAAFIPYIILLFAGPWADRYNKLKAVLMLPIVGKCLFYMHRYFASTYFESLPYELSCFCSILPKLFGGDPCFMMAVFSFLTTTTPKTDRLLRLSIFGVAAVLTDILIANIEIVNPNRLDYSKYFAISVICEIAAILYICFLIKDPKPLRQPQDSDNNMDHLQLRSHLVIRKVKRLSELSRFNLLIEFFDPTFVMELIKLPFKRRDNNGRLILLLLNLCFFLTIGHRDMEYNIVDYNPTKYGWYNSLISTYYGFRYVTYLIGTFVGAVILSKILKFSDSMIGIWAAFFTVVYRLILEFAEDSDTYFIAEVFNMFAMFRILTIQTIATTINEGDGNGKLFSFYGTVEPIALFTFQQMYKAVTPNTAESFPKVAFVFNEFFYVSIVLMLIGCYFLMRRREANLADRNEQNEEQNSRCDL